MADPAQWTDIANSDKYQALAPDMQDAVRSQYFDKVIAPKIPDSLDPNTVKTQFLTATAPDTNKPGIADGSEDLATNINSNLSIGKGVAGGIAKAALGVGEAGTYAYQGLGKAMGDTKIPFTDISGNDIASAASGGRDIAAQDVNTINQNEASSADPRGAKYGDVIGQAVPYLAAPETAVADVGPAWLGAGLKYTPGAALTAGATTNTGNESGGQALAERGKAALETGAATAVAPGILQAGANIVKPIAGVVSDVGNFGMGLFSSAAREANAEKSVGQQLVANTGGDKEASLKTINQNQDVFNHENPDINPTTTQLLPDTQSVAATQKKSVQNNVTAAEDQAKQALADHASSQPDAQAAQMSEASLRGKSTDLSNQEANAQSNLEQQGQEFTDNSRTNTAGQAAKSGSADTLGSEQALRAENDANYKIQAEAQASVPVDNNALKESLNSSVQHSPDLDSALAKVKEFNGGTDLTRQLEIAGFAGKFHATSGGAPVTMDALTSASSDVSSALSDSSVKLTNAEKTSLTNFQKGLDDYKQQLVEAQPVDVQAKLTAGDDFFKNNVLPLRQQALPRDLTSKPNLAAPDLSQAPETPVTSGPYTRQTANRAGERQALTQEQVNPVNFYRERGVTTGEASAQPTQDLVNSTQGGEHSTNIKNYVKANVQAAAVGADGTVDINKLDTLINDPNKGWKSTIDQLKPSDAQELNDLYQGTKDLHDANTSMRTQARLENTPYLDLFGKMDANKAKIADDITSNPQSLDSFLSLSKDLGQPAQDAQKEWAKQMLMRPDGNVVDIDPKTGLKSINQEWLNKVNQPGTQENDVKNALWGKDAPDVDKLVDMGKTLGYNAPINEQKGISKTADAVKTIAYFLKLRYGTISEGTKTVTQLLNKAYDPAMQRALIDPEYAKQLISQYKSSDWSGFADTLGNAGLPQTTAAAEGRNTDNDNKPVSPVTKLQAGPLDKVSDVFTDYENSQQKPEGSSNAFKDFDNYSNDTLPPPANPDLGKSSFAATDQPTQKKSNAVDDMITYGKTDTIARNLKLEGGFVNNPSDPGGATNMGITLRTLQSVDPSATVQDVKNLTSDEASKIYDQKYWTPNHIDQMPEGVQDVAFDSFVQHGDTMGAKIIQRALANMGQPVTVDGKIGDDTIEAMNKVDPATLRMNILSSREAFYRQLASNNPSQKQFLNGWLNRLDQLT